MKELFVNVVLLSLMASTLGNFWTLCLTDGMIFGKLGSKLRYRIECEKDDCPNVNEFPWYIKLIKGLGCPFCVTIWIMVVVHIIFYWFMSSEGLTVMWWIFLLLFEIGITTLFNKIQTVFINSKLPF